ncbi:MAG: nitroreductase family protein [Clostridiales bacterium]|nr:nitroreductase family protein [Clostridiales bacterium]
MGIYELILRRRTIRQFQPVPVPRSVLEKIVNAGRLAPSAGNLQPLEFVAVDDDEVRAAIFPCLRWAAYISPRGDPMPGQEPAAYIICLVNLRVREKGYEHDVGAAMENMTLAAWEEGIGSCWLISVDRKKVAEILAIPDEYRVDSVLALGYPAENPVAEDFRGSVKYWKDEAGVLHVPKRSLKDILHFNRFG